MSVVDLLKKIHPRTVIWFLLTAIFCLIAFVGKHYDTRLGALEEYKKEQNGHLRQIDIRLERIDTSLQHIKEKVK